VGGSGCILSCLIFNGHADCGCRLPGHLLEIRGSPVRLPGSRVCVELGKKDKLSGVDRWRDPACS
jgi:hypothetical protein